MCQSFDKILFYFILMTNIENSVICVILNEFYCICVLQVPSALAADREKTWSLCPCAVICSFHYSCLLTHLFVLACTCLLNYLFKNVRVCYLNYDQSPHWAV